MAAKKRRARAAKARPQQASGGPSVPRSSSSHYYRELGASRAPMVPAMTQGKAALIRHRGDVTRGKHIDSSDSSLILLPRDIRDKIYALLLTAPEGSKAQVETRESDKHSGHCHQSTRLTSLLATSEILPGSLQRYPFITESIGLLLANKQLHSEANAYLFSHNTFVIMPEWERIHCFWSCNNNICRPHIPCLVHFRNFRQIKHLHIVVNNPHGFEEMSQKYAARRLRNNIGTMVKCLKEAGIKLLTLKVRYMSCLQGQIDDVREELDAEPNDQYQQQKATTIGTRGGERYSLGAMKDQSILFQNTDVLDALITLPGIADNVTIIGDLPTSDITELVSTLRNAQSSDVDMEEPEMIGVGEAAHVNEVHHTDNTDQTGVSNEANEVDKTNSVPMPDVVPADLAKLNVTALQTVATAIQCPDKADSEARAALLQKLSLNHPEDKEMRDFCEKTMRGPTYTLAFMEQLLMPTQQEVDQRRQLLKQQKRQKRSKKA